MLRSLTLLVAASCVCVADPGDGNFPCDTKADCIAGFDCVGARCVRAGGTADGGGNDGGSRETNCANSIDDDQDGQTDCADSDCDSRSCGSSQVCCGTACKYLPSDTNNCGGCGLVCSTAQPCVSAATTGGLTGACGCFNTTCPGSLHCVNNSGCECTSAGDCATGEVCDHGGGIGLCRYP